MNAIDHYEIINRVTKEVVGIAYTLKGATNSVNKRDEEYGAVKFAKRPVFITGEYGPAF